jgi:hypothetical protein
MTFTRVALIATLVLAVLLIGTWAYFEHFANARVSRELLADPNGERAAKVMLITLPSGRSLPVNYLRVGDRVYAGADGRWWKELVGDGLPVSLVVRGEELSGVARAVLDDPEYTQRIFSELRPNAIKGFGTLIEVRLEGTADDDPATP